MDYEKFLDRQFKMTDAGRIDRVRDLYTTFNPRVDLEEMKACGYLDALAVMMEPVLDQFDDHAPENIAYWAKLGMVKEFHGEDEPMSWSEYEMRTGYHWEDPDRQGIQNRFKKWNSFVPVSAFRKENKNRKYPVVVVLHGGFNPISIIDGWGFVQEAARREWIVVVPSIELDDIIDEILAKAKELYPIDESRIYASGTIRHFEGAYHTGRDRGRLSGTCIHCAPAWSKNFRSNHYALRQSHVPGRMDGRI